MPLTDEQNELLTTVLETLEPELKDMKPGERSFVEDQLKRHEQYGADIRLSPKQRTWLQDIYERVSGEKVEL